MENAIIEITNALLGIDHPWAAYAVAFLIALTAIVGSASIIVDGVERITKITPTQKDDIFVGRVKRFIAKVLAILDRLALNPPKDRARNE